MSTEFRILKLCFIGTISMILKHWSDFLTLKQIQSIVMIFDTEKQNKLITLYETISVG